MAKRDGYKYIWIDTCCIDKSSSAELSESINSMFKWYEWAGVCYAYLSDVHLQVQFSSDSNALPDISSEDFRASRWFTRGWTLQQLIAPKEVHFYAHDWQYLCSRSENKKLLEDITGVDGAVYPFWSIEQSWHNKANSLYAFSIAQRMSWASKRSMVLYFFQRWPKPFAKKD